MSIARAGTPHEGMHKRCARRRTSMLARVRSPNAVPREGGAFGADALVRAQERARRQKPESSSPVPK
eukprot:15456211-Alexandrium_andersonii.AAC.1